MHVSAYLRRVKNRQSQHHFADMKKEIHNIPFSDLFSGVFELIYFVLQASKLSAEDLMAGVDLIEVLLVDYSQRYASFGTR